MPFARKLNDADAALLARCLEFRRLLSNKALQRRFGIHESGFRRYAVPREAARNLPHLSEQEIDSLAAHLTKLAENSPEQTQ